MVRPALLAMLVAGWLGSSMAATTAERLSALADDLHAVAADCPEGLEHYGIAAEARCFAVGESFRAVKRAVEAHLSTDGWPLDAWTEDGGYKARSAPGPGEVLVVLFDAKQGILVVVPHRPCPVDPRVHSAEEAGTFQAPRRIAFESPDVPGLGGLAILRVLIREDGSVGDPCFLHVEPAGAQVQQAVTRSVEKWRYEPARLEGQPVPTYSVVTISWSTTRN